MPSLTTWTPMEEQPPSDVEYFSCDYDIANNSLDEIYTDAAGRRYTA